MNTEQQSYRQIIKATSLFGGVQVVHIIVAIVRSKFVAVLLGPTGMGIVGLLNSTTGFVSALTNFGLGNSAVKNIAAAASTGNEDKVSTVVSVLRRLVWITGLLGMVITAVLSPWLSELTFGNKNYTLAFIWISITLLLKQLSSGQMIILQGLRKLRYLARANVTGSVIGLIISLPVYYIWGLDGIVPVIIISSCIAILLSWYYSRKVGIKSVEINIKETIIEGREMLKMGFILSLSGLITIGASYLVRIYISSTGSVEQVGLYTAGFALINTYVGMVFTAMGTDYYPRLSAVANDNQKSNELINQQAEIAFLLLAPILLVFLIFINPVVILLYSQKFVVINEMIRWAALGIFFKAVSWPVGFLLIAQGDSKVYFWSELISNAYLLFLNILGYKYLGLNGLGISFLAYYILKLIQVFIITKVKYSFSFEKEFYKIAGFQLLIGLLCFYIIRTISKPWTYILGSVLIILSSFYSLRELEKRIGLKEIGHRLLNNFRGKGSKNGETK